jgi:hypothetical protein
MKLKDILEKFKRQEYVFHTDLSVEECISKMKESIIEEEDYDESIKTTPYIGRIRGSTFRLLTGPHPRSFSSMKFRPGSSYYRYFHGEFIADHDGTRIIGHFGLGGKKGLIVYILFLLYVLSLILLPSSKYGFTPKLFIALFLLIPVVFFYYLAAEVLKDEIIKLFKTNFQATLLFPVEQPHKDSPTNPEDDLDLDENFVFYSRRSPSHKV